MFYVLLTVHLLLCFALVGLVLIQQGKGADMGATFGGGSNALFGAGGATNLIVRVTTGIAIAFMFTSILLVRAYSQQSMEGGSSRRSLLDDTSIVDSLPLSGPPAGPVGSGGEKAAAPAATKPDVVPPPAPVQAPAKAQ